MDQKRRKRFWLSVTLVIAVTSIAVIFIVFDNTSQDTQAVPVRLKGTIVVGGKDFTEQYILTEMTTILLKENGYKVKEVSGMPHSKVVRSALLDGHIDMYWEYTGTAFRVFKGSSMKQGSEEVYQLVKQWDKTNNISWLQPTTINNSYVLLMRKQQANQLNITSISDLADYMNQHQQDLDVAVNDEFLTRSDGLYGLEKHYNFHIPEGNLIEVTSGLLYHAIKNGRVDVSLGYATDGQLQKAELVTLKDDRSFFPPYILAPVIREETLQNHPELKSLLQQIARNLDNQTIADLNYQVDVQHKNITKVSREWLVSEGLITD